ITVQLSVIAPTLKISLYQMRRSEASASRVAPNVEIMTTGNGNRKMDAILIAIEIDISRLLLGLFVGKCTGYTSTMAFTKIRITVGRMRDGSAPSTGSAKKTASRLSPKTSKI